MLGRSKRNTSFYRKQFDVACPTESERVTRFSSRLLLNLGKAHFPLVQQFCRHCLQNLWESIPIGLKETAEKPEIPFGETGPKLLRELSATLF